MANQVLRLKEMSLSSALPKGDLLNGITREGNIATTETLIRGKSRTIRRITSIH